MADDLKTILVVDDEDPVLRIVEKFLKKLGHKCVTAVNGLEALDKLNPGIDLVILDIGLPGGLDGIGVVRSIREGEGNCKDIPILMATGLTYDEDRAMAYKAGANDYLCKPITLVELKTRVESLLKVKEAQDTLKNYNQKLSLEVEKRSESLRKALEEKEQVHKQLKQANLEAVSCLAVAAEYRDTDTGNHIHRVSSYCALLARGVGLPSSEVDILFHASAMHDVGKIGIPDSILLKPGKLTKEEFEIIKQHTLIGCRILSGTKSELMRAGKIVAMTHHERWDGKGYPDGIKGDKIPLWGRITAIADVFDALTSKRPYKDAFPAKKAFKIIKEGRGTQFDPELVDLFLSKKEEAKVIMETYQE